MKLVPNAVSRFGHRSLLKLNASSPTILVVGGVVGLGVTAVMAARATRRIDPVLDRHKQDRATIGYVGTESEQQKELLRLYVRTGSSLGRLYGPTILVGATSALAVLGGHRILRGRHIATMAAYTGLAEQFNAYRQRVVKTLGEDLEKEIYEGAHGEYVEDPDHKGEYKLKAKHNDVDSSYLRPWFDETNVNWTRDAVNNYQFLKAAQAHMNNLLQIRGHVFLNDVLDQLHMPRCAEGSVSGWLWKSADGDNFVDFGFMTSDNPNTVAFRNGVEQNVQLNFNIDGIIWDQI